MPYRILHVVGSGLPGNTAVVSIVEQLTDRLPKDRFCVEAAFLWDGPLATRLRQHGIGVTVLDWGATAKEPIGAARAASLLHSGGYEIVHLHTGGRLLTHMARLLGRSKVVVHLHGRVAESRGLALLTPKVTAADAVIATSHAVATRVRAMPLVVTVVHPGIDLEKSPVTCPDTPAMAIGTACRLERVKGLDYLIGATALLIKEFPDLRLEIAGEGSQRASLENACRAAGLEHHVQFLGWRDDVRSAMRRWKVFVLPSLDEGFGISAIEAMGCGVPVVASRVGGLCEIVEDGRTGFLVPPKDAYAIANGVAFLLHDREAREGMARRGVERVQQHFSAAAMARAVEQVYNSLLAREKPETNRT